MPRRSLFLDQTASRMRNDAGKILYELWAGGTEDFNAFRDGMVCLSRTSIWRLPGSISASMADPSKSGVST